MISKPVFYLRVKVIGTIYHTGTGFPPCLPGLNAGNVLTTLIASLSSSGSTPLRTLTWLTPPLAVTQNRIITLPWILFSFATSGYCTCSIMNLRSAASPPGYIGISSTTTNGTSTTSVSCTSSLTCCTTSTTSLLVTSV